jgi:hypothetical protein
MKLPSSLAWKGLSAVLLLSPVLSFGQAPANDDFANATLISLGSGSSSADNTNATSEVGEFATADQKTVWWKWTAPEAGLFSFDTFGSGVEDTIIFLGSGTGVGDFIVNISNDDSGTSFQSKVVYSASAGEEVYIAVDSFSGGVGGAITLNWEPAAALTLPPMVYNWRSIYRDQGQAYDPVTFEGIFDDVTGAPIWARPTLSIDSGLVVRGRKDGAYLDQSSEKGPCAVFTLWSERVGRVTTRYYSISQSVDGYSSELVQYGPRSFVEETENDTFSGRGAAAKRAMYRGGPLTVFATQQTGASLNAYPNSLASEQGVAIPGSQFSATDSLTYNAALSARPDVATAPTFQDAVDALETFLQSRAGGGYVLYVDPVTDPVP